MYAVKLGILLLFLAPVLAADEEKIPLDKDSVHRLEVLVLKQQLAATQLQLLREQIKNLQTETTTIMRALYDEAGLDPDEYSLDLENLVFKRIEKEETNEENASSP